MRPDDERGEGKFGTIVGLLIMAAIALAAWNVIPVYYADYSFADKMVEVARLQKYNNPDDEIMRKLMKEARELRIEAYVNNQSCQINTADHSRKITCKYERTVEVLPGYKRKFKFEHLADQPLL
jgi:hypothetical protein